ncbi:MAG: glycosyltransferase family 4 protein [Actinomycetota bacterium]|nr:glycosyltransferase family 4 protein [Actinomycetota bacterium]
MNKRTGDLRPLRIAFCVYRGNPYSGGQGVYTKHLSHELAKRGHTVEVYSGQPYPDLDPESVVLNKLASLDLYRAEDPFRIPKIEEFGSLIDVAEFALMCSGGFPEPRTFGWRLERALESRLGDFDLIHDNQSLSWSILRLAQKGLPVIGSIHHPITVDRALAIEHGRGLKSKIGAYRWYGFVKMQSEVASRMERVLTVSETSRTDLFKYMNVALERSRVVPIGVDTSVFKPNPAIRREPGLIVTTASADVPLKGLQVLVEAMAEVKNVEPKSHLVIIGNPNKGSNLPSRVFELGLDAYVKFAGVVAQDEMVRLYNRAEVAVVPSLYEGFSLPAVEAMACGVPLVATDGGALPEVTGTDGETVLMARAGDYLDLAKKILQALDSSILRDELGRNAMERVMSKFTWEATARATEQNYFDLLSARGED